MKVYQSYKYGTSNEFLAEANLSDGTISLINLSTGVSGNGFIPADSDTITVYSNFIGTGVDFRPALNNDIYYYLTNSTNPSVSDVLTGTKVTLSFSGGRYSGTFVLSNPDQYNYLVLMSDYRNKLAEYDVVSDVFNNGDSVVIDSVTGLTPGEVKFSYTTTDGPCRLALEYNGNILADTGNMPSASTGFISFTKKTNTNDFARVIIVNGVDSNTVTIGQVGSVLTSFYIDTTDGTLSNVCSQAATTMYYHDGSSTLPIAGDTIYLDAIGTNVYNGNNAYHVISTTSMGAPSSTSTYAAVTDLGNVISIGGCQCLESLIPVITQPDIEVIQNDTISIYIEATNNPNSWSISSSCLSYDLSGEDRGAVFNYTDCDSVPQTISVGVKAIKNVCATSTPTLVTGTGTVTEVGVCTDTTLPKGFTFLDGILSGAATETGVTQISLIASNCVGDSLATPINITVKSVFKLTPFAIDTESPQDTGSSACLLSAVYTQLYHNGVTTIPAKNDIIYYDADSITPFRGGDLWYNLSGSTYSVQIDSNGVIIDTNNC